jgi:hypothetical protein
MAELKQAVLKFASDLAEKVESFVDDVAELKVQTYVKSAEGDVLRAETTVSFNGDMVVVVPMDVSGEIDKSVWDLHRSMVQQAMVNRASMVQSVGDAAASALKAMGVASE